jgi:hypothetical protein
LIPDALVLMDVTIVANEVPVQRFKFLRCCNAEIFEAINFIGKRSRKILRLVGVVPPIKFTAAK